MTWLMAAIDVVKNEVEGAKHCHYLIAPMPLGTGNDLAQVAELGRPLFSQNVLLKMGL